MSPDTKALIERAKAVLERQQILLTRARQLQEEGQALLDSTKLSTATLPARPPLMLPVPEPAPVPQQKPITGQEDAADAA